MFQGFNDQIFRTPLFKEWTKAMADEIPELIKKSSIYPELKPENVTFIELVQTDGGFIAGHYEIAFKVQLNELRSLFAIIN